MTKDELIAWANDPQRQDTLPFGLYEPHDQKPIVGAALVVRGVFYFKDGHTRAVRDSLVSCYSRYMDAIAEYAKVFAQAAEQPAPSASSMRWFYEEGEKPVEFAHARGFAAAAEAVPSSEVFVATTTSADHKHATGFFEFSAFCISDWQAEQGDRGLDAMVFTVPRRFLELCLGVFEQLFADFAATVPTIWGHAGIGVNLPPLDPETNEASENFWSRLYGPGIDVGDPMRTSIRELESKIKTVDWLLALDADFVRRAGGAETMMLPPDWYRKAPLGASGLLIQAGLAPVAGVPIGKGITPAPPASYVLLNHALRAIVADEVGILQRGTINSTAPLFNTTVSSEEWLRRFNVSDEEINRYWLELHETPKLM
ncbi:type VI immunity family protein [Burkholderia gladioli]|uniref:type VI immunity family protein n=1 Tax=Burkholderia gladioli TaxID=28095 RepID=UPI002FE27FF6